MNGRSLPLSVLICTFSTAVATAPDSDKPNKQKKGRRFVLLPREFRKNL